MLSLSKVVVGCLASALMVLGFSVSAQAATVASGAFVVNGSATAEVDWVGSAGNYNFNSGFFQVIGAGVFDADTSITGNEGVAVVQVDAPHNSVSGSGDGFTNVVVGTGTAGKKNVVPTSVVDPLPSGVQDPADVSTAASILLNTNFGYQIVFAGGQGKLFWSATGGDPKPDLSAFDPNTSSAPVGDKHVPVGGGAINISPWFPTGDPAPVGGAEAFINNTVIKPISHGGDNQSIVETVTNAGNVVTNAVFNPPTPAPTRATKGFTVFGVVTGTIND